MSGERTDVDSARFGYAGIGALIGIGVGHLIELWVHARF